jgi:hypothetical protein
VLTYGELEQAQEDANFAACRAAFAESFPHKPLFLYAQCKDGEWECAKCPWKKPKGDDS